jgi:hypothetical protein
MQGKDRTDTPLAANQSYFGRWIDLSGNGDLPLLGVTAQADQAGMIQVNESDNPTDSGQITISGGSAVKAGMKCDCFYPIRKRFAQVVFSNGCVAQTSFVLDVREYSPAQGYSDSRLLDLILREQRIQTLILMQLREPYGSTLNIRPSLDQIES